LASCVLGMVIREFPGEFEARYGHRPLLLESFVDTSHDRGTCYRAANWQYVGRTKGRGRQDVFRKRKESRKDIYVYPLEDDFRKEMGLPEGSGLGAIDIRAGIDGGDWTEKEFGGASLGDERLSQRLVEIAADKAEQPARAYCGVAEGDWPKIKAYYRFIDKPDDSGVTMSAILQPHRERTIQRMKAQKRVLCIQDGSDLNYSTLEGCEGLGSVGTNQTGKQSKGLHLHSTFAVTSSGLPLGVLRAECTAREPRSPQEDRPLSAIPITPSVGFRACAIAWISNG
ncbi:MAG: DUF4338 domain-containing protein, partial [Planctomycetes bacterium]|nr:DUF4338 domain-containing protein [Planctomycetota bacterium]